MSELTYWLERHRLAGFDEPTATWTTACGREFPDTDDISTQHPARPCGACMAAPARTALAAARRPNFPANRRPEGPHA